MKEFDNPNIQKYEIEHNKIIKKYAPESTLFLKRTDILPLSIGKVALFGSGARKTLKGGTGSGDLSVRHVVSIEEGLQNAGFEIVSGDYLDKYDKLIKETRKNWIKKLQSEAKEKGIHSVLYAMGKIMPEPDYEFNLNYECDTAIYVLSRICGEGADRLPVKGDIYLTDTEKREINYLNEKYPKFVLVLNVGGLVDLAEVSKVNNILLLGQLGAFTGDVLADILLGKAFPSGKLAMTWADINKYPSTPGFGSQDDTDYEEDVFVGYRYFGYSKDFYYPFGYGLSYTDFNIVPIKHYVEGKKCHIDCEIENIGKYPGKEVVQVYYSLINENLNVNKELIAYTKTGEIPSGQKENISFDIELDCLSSFDEKKNSYIIQKGVYVIKLGNNSENLNSLLAIKVSEDVVLEKVKPISRMNINQHCFQFKNNEDITALETYELDSSYYHTIVHHYDERHEIKRNNKHYNFNLVKNNDISLDEFVGSLTDEQLIQMCIGKHNEVGSGLTSVTAIGFAGSDVVGSAGDTCDRLLDMGVPTLTMADGPAGLRIANSYIVINDVPKALDGDILSASEFLTEEERAYVEQLMNKPSEEEKNATVYYQYCSALPIATCIAQTFNDHAAEQYGGIVGEEMKLFGLNLWLAPALNIQRNPLCGRNFEYYSEDPLLSGKMAAAICRGVDKSETTSCVIKHFACNSQETNRGASSSNLSEKALREIYLKGFKIAVRESHVKAIMTSTNLLNGIHTCAHKQLIDDILREEFGFVGLVMTDWYVTNNKMYSLNPDNKYDSTEAYLNVLAGNDICMPGEERDKINLYEHLNKEVKIKDLQYCAKNVLQTILSLNK